ncbi:MAG: LysR family transcriptional regulator [Alphaproteobacteria bacterium]|nr:LysR family transcriptional regulator [Alphaproteobacteria bacterium]
MIPFTIRQIEHAIAVLDHGSVARASEALGIAQPTVSASLAKLEDIIGIQLFIRHHAQGVSPSPQGIAFLSEARNLLSHAQDLHRQSAEAGTAVEGTICVGSFTTIAPVFTPQLVAGFQTLHPKASITLQEGTQDKLLDGLRAGRFDCALLYDVDMPDDLVLTRLGAFQPHVLLPAGHHLAKNTRVSLKDVANEPFILLDIAPSRTYFTRILEKEGVIPKIAFSSPSLEVVRGLVGQGLGYSILITRPSGDTSYSGEHLAVRPIAEPVQPGIIALASLKQLRKTRLVQSFEEFCVEKFKMMWSPM